MGFLAPKSSPPPRVPTKEDPSVTAAKEQERLALSRRRGRSDTINTSPLGAPDPQVVRRPSLLGQPV